MDEENTTAIAEEPAAPAEEKVEIKPQAFIDLSSNCGELLYPRHENTEAAELFIQTIIDKGGSIGKAKERCLETIENNARNGLRGRVNTLAYYPYATSQMTEYVNELIRWQGQDFDLCLVSPHDPHDRYGHERIKAFQNAYAAKWKELSLEQVIEHYCQLNELLYGVLQTANIMLMPAERNSTWVQSAHKTSIYWTSLKISRVIEQNQSTKLEIETVLTKPQTYTTYPYA